MSSLLPMPSAEPTFAGVEPEARGEPGETPAGRQTIQWLGAPLAIWAASRVLLLVVAQQAPRLLAAPRRVASPSVLPRSDILASVWSWASPWFRFDSRWFVGVAVGGYHWGSHGAANTNFLPVYPALIRLFAPLSAGSFWLSSWMVSNLACLVAVTLIYRWAHLRFDTEGSVRVVLLTVCFPFAFFFSAAYAESMFLALAVGAFLAAETDHWGTATVLAGVATVTRPVGLALAAGLVILALGRRQRAAAASLLLAVLPLAAFSAYLGVRYRQPLGFLVNHSGGWVHPHGGILPALGQEFHTYLSPFDRVDAALAILFLVSGVAAWRRIGAGYGVYVLLGVFFPLAHGLVGMERYVIVLFPAMAAWASWEGKGRQAAAFSLSLMGLILATTMFAVGFAFS